MTEGFVAGADPMFAFGRAENFFDRGGERREDAEYEAVQRAHSGARTVLVRADGSLAVDPDAGALVRLQSSAVPGSPLASESSLLGFEHGAPLFAVGLQEAFPTHHEWLDLRTIAARLPAHEAGIAAYARALLHWQSRARFCGRCGARTQRHAMGHRVICSSDECGEIGFPRTDVAVIVLVEHAGRALLGRQESWGPYRFSTLAGFVEPGETLEDAVRREVFEESGVRVGEVRYEASQPWPFPASLMVGFRAQALTDAITVGDEIVEARWFSPDDIDRERIVGTLKLSPTLSISRWLLARWYRDATGHALTD